MLKDSSLKKRVLALHGSGSNSSVTEIQLRNLGISNSEFDILYINGPIVAAKPGPGLEELGALVGGPWYSWLPSEQDGALSNGALRSALCEAVRTVLSCIEEYGPFDGIYGFSQGGVIANLVNGLAHDETLMSALREHTGEDLAHLSAQSAPFGCVVAA
jgi:hypothetical protein